MYILRYLIASIISCYSYAQLHESQDFLTSFIYNYGFSSNSYDTREYHPFILHQTASSFSSLEKHLSTAGFIPQKRYVIFGYQENAVPSYYTAHHTNRIQDEHAIKTAGGWRFAHGNMAGLLTGFALSSAPNDNRLVTHIIPEQVELFDPTASIFHEHAFGQAYPHACIMRKETKKALQHHNAHQLLSLLSAWWKKLYIDGCRDGAGNIVATQDILFNTNYAQYLLQSQLPITQIYTGPDITYPIEVLPCQSLQSTKGSQAFLHTLTKQLDAPHERKTAYIFCSFVDGVGKTTLLGNIRNWIQHGTAFEQYQHVDNTSSQRATLYEVHNNVVIVDLPAQVSHFTIKPEGYVYVDYKALPEDASLYTRIISYALTQLPQLSYQWTTSFMHTLPGFTTYEGLCKALQRETITWIPFTYAGEQYLIHQTDHHQLKKKVSLTNVHSHGLKVVEPEHMIFSEGVSLPLPYHIFLDDLVTQLTQHNVEDIVFIDFMSMYPRTSRETIRVNFLLQQLYALYAQSFQQEHSFYDQLPHPHQYYVKLKKNREAIMQSLTHEAFIRYAWYDLLCDQTRTYTHIPAEDITAILQDRIHTLRIEHTNKIDTLLKTKIQYELDEFEHTYAQDKIFHTIISFDPDRIVRFSDWLTTFFGTRVQNNYYQELWYPLNAPVARIIAEANGQQLILENGTRLHVIKELSWACQDPLELEDVLRLLRAQWYATITNILACTQESGDIWSSREPIYYIPPLVAKKGPNNNWYIATPVLPAHEEKTDTVPSLFLKTASSNHQHAYVSYHDHPHYASWQQIDTSQDIYAYGYNQHDTSHPISSLLRTYLQTKHDADAYITADELYHLCEARHLFSSNAMPKNSALCTHPDQAAIKLCVQALATLEMIIKDMKSVVISRVDQQKDFIATLHLIEHITLPTYFGITSRETLYEDYDTIKPVINL